MASTVDSFSSKSTATSTAISSMMEVKLKGNFEIGPVMIKVDGSVTEITKGILNSIADSKKVQKSSKDLAAERVKTLSDFVTKPLTENEEMVAKKLTEATIEHIDKYSRNFLGRFLVQLEKETNADTKNQFIASFVNPEARKLTAQLETFHPQVWTKKIWE